MRISTLLKRNRPTVSFEFFPPKTEIGRDSLLRVIGRLAQVSPDFVSVTYGAGGATRVLSFDTCCQVQASTDAQVMAHLTCVHHTREEIATITDQLWDVGIENIMALRGDRPKDSNTDLAFGDFSFGKELIGFLKTRHDFCLGGGCYPEGHTETPDIALGIEHLREKVDAGCEFLVTQVFFDNASYFRFMELLGKAGVDTPVIPGIMPITGFAQLDKFENQFGVRLPNKLRERVAESEGDEDAIRKIGVEWATEQCRALIGGGAPGIHFYTLNKSLSTVEVCKDLGLTGASNVV